MKNTFELETKYNAKEVLSATDCYEDNPSYGTYMQMFQDIVDTYGQKLEPKAYIRFVENRIYCLVTLNKEVEGWVKEKFDKYEYLDGMLLNALADNVLYNGTSELYKILNGLIPDGKFLSSRFEPGHINVPMTVQKEIFDQIVPAFNLDMIITEGYMISPGTSLMYYYKLTEDDCALGIDHDCTHCTVGCDNRLYKITLKENDQTRIVQGKKGENLLDLLRRHDVFLDAPCGGKRVCGKCKVRVENHAFDLKEDEKVFLGNLVSQDYLLACFHTINDDLVIDLKDIQYVISHDKHHIEIG